MARRIPVAARRLGLAALTLFCLSAGASAVETPVLGADSGLPVPRFVSLKTQGANGRRGPGVEHKIEWIYERPGLPLQVTGESGPWRRVRDPDEGQVWMHAQNLDNRRTIYARPEAGGNYLALRSAPRDTSRAVAYLAPGVIGALTACDGAWRRVAVGGRVGWAHQDSLWGGEDCRGL